MVIITSGGGGGGGEDRDYGVVVVGLIEVFIKMTIVIMLRVGMKMKMVRGGSDEIRSGVIKSVQ